MRKQLFLQLPADGPSEAGDWCWVVRDDERPGGSLFRGPLADSVKQAAGARVVVLVPGVDVLLASAELPGLNRQRLARAVPFALEEQLASDVEDLHFALGQRDHQGRIHNAVVAREKVAAWLEQLRAAGLQADVMLSEVLAVPREAANDAGRHWSLLIDGARCLLRSDSQQGLALDLDNLAVVLRAALDAADGDGLPARLDVKVCGDGGFAGSDHYRQLDEICTAAGIELVLQPQDDDGALLLARGFDEKSAINLLQGDYSRRGQLEKLLRPWRPAALLLGLWLVIQLGAMGLEYQRLAAQNEAMREQITALYREAFPQARKVVNPRVQMERGLARLRGSGGQTDLLGFIAEAGPILKATPGLKLRSLRYKENRLDIDLEIGTLQALDKLKQRLGDEAGLAVEIVSASSRDGKVESRIALQSGGEA